MSIQMWGPGLEAEMAYRQERLEADLRPRRGRPTVEGRRADRREVPRGSAPGRRWWLLGSGTWHVAR